jgi:hypothetical protein
VPERVVEYFFSISWAVSKLLVVAGFDQRFKVSEAADPSVHACAD